MEHPCNSIVIVVFSFSDIYRSKNILKNFNEFLVNLFMPLYEVSIDPKSHEKLHKFLQQVSWNISNMINHKAPCSIIFDLQNIFECTSLRNF